jgi:hypothetical protein
MTMTPIAFTSGEGECDQRGDDDPRNQRGNDHPPEHLHLVGAQIGRRLLEGGVERREPGLDDQERVGRVPDRVADHDRRQTDRNPGADEQKEQRAREHHLRQDDVDQDQDLVEPAPASGRSPPPKRACDGKWNGDRRRERADQDREAQSPTDLAVRERVAEPLQGGAPPADQQLVSVDGVDRDDHERRPQHKNDDQRDRRHDHVPADDHAGSPMRWSPASLRPSSIKTTSTPSRLIAIADPNG